MTGVVYGEQQELSIGLSIHPSSGAGKVLTRSTVQFQCSVDMNILGHGSIEWFRRVGVNRYQIGANSFIHSHVTAPRYQFDRQKQTSATTAVYTLTITGLCTTRTYTDRVTER